MARDAETMGDPSTWDVARELGKQLIIPVGPYEPRVPTADEMNAVLPYLLDRATTFYEPRYFCENAELALANLLGMNVPRQGFPKKDGFSRHGYDWEGFNRDGLDLDGYNRQGLDRRGFNKDGFDKDGYNYYGYDKDGFNKKGRDQDGHTREERIAAQVNGWSDEFAAAIAAQVAQLQAETPTGSAPVKKATKRAPAAKKAAPRKKAPAKPALVAA